MTLEGLNDQNHANEGNYDSDNVNFLDALSEHALGEKRNHQRVCKKKALGLTEARVHVGHEE